MTFCICSFAPHIVHDYITDIFCNYYPIIVIDIPPITIKKRPLLVIGDDLPASHAHDQWYSLTHVLLALVEFVKIRS